MRTAMKKLVVCTVAASVVLGASIANAGGAAAPISSLPTLPAPAPVRVTTPAAIAVPGVSLKSRDGFGGSKWHELTAATGRGYCFSATDTGLRFMDSYGTSSKGDLEELDLNRLVEKDGKTSLERTRIVFDPSTATVTPKGRSTVELSEITRGPDGVVVWAYRTGHEVMVITKRADRGMESHARGKPEDGIIIPFVSVDNCTYAGARLDVKRAESGSYAQLVGNLPPKGEGKEKVQQRFLVDASLSKVARDPEPILSVRIRVRD